jgi:hypothetical protein
VRKKNRSLFLVFFLIMGLSGLVHYQLLPLEQTFILKSYVINTILAASALGFLSWGIHNKKSNLTGLYLITVALKFIVYFLFFYPIFQEDDTLMRQEFFIFFTPYAIGLLSEIILLVRRYN